MIALDADVLTEILAGHSGFSQRAALIPPDEQGIPVIVVEKLTRGRLNSIRQAEAGKSKLTIERAYELFEATLHALRQLRVLSYTSAAEAIFQQWGGQKIRVGTHDLRIAALCIVHSATLVTRNRRDFEQIPGLVLDVWESCRFRGARTTFRACPARSEGTTLMPCPTSPKSSISFWFRPAKR